MNDIANQKKKFSELLQKVQRGQTNKPLRNIKTNCLLSNKIAFPFQPYTIKHGKGKLCQLDFATITHLIYSIITWRHSKNVVEHVLLDPLTSNNLFYTNYQFHLKWKASSLSSFLSSMWAYQANSLWSDIHFKPNKETDSKMN